MEHITLIGTIFGGLGLFLLAITMMTDGLKLAAGATLRSLLSNWSKTPLRGLFSGYLMTAVVQSSSAVTVASLGFVNAGLINMRQALGIVYGANVGTTMTGWLVAIIGFKLNIQAFALPMIGLGMLLKLINVRDQLAAFGMALVGFGLFFMGIDILKGAFDGLVQTFDLSQFKAEGLLGIGNFLLIGLVMTILTQSSSASIALTITAASTGMIGVYAAGAMVIGANIGTTSTALFATIGATSNAKRVATAQVVFNLLTAMVALLILPVLFYLIDALTKLLNVTADPAISLAVFHTLFNILGVLLIFPHNDRFAAFLDKRFVTWEEQASHPRFLDMTIAQTPVLAVNALLLELNAIADKVSEVNSKVLSKCNHSATSAYKEISVIRTLLTKVSDFIVSIESSALNDDTTMDMSTLMRAQQNMQACLDAMSNLFQRLEAREALNDSHLEAQFIRHQQELASFIALTRIESMDQEALKTGFENQLKRHEAFKSQLIMAATRAQVTIEQMAYTSDCLGELLQIAQHWVSALSRISQTQASIETPESNSLEELSA